MPDANAVAIVSVVATATATTVGASIAAWVSRRNLRDQLAGEAGRQARAFDHEREVRDVAELRDLLDECAEQIRGATVIAGQVLGWLVVEPGAPTKLERLQSTLDEVTIQRRSIDQSVARLSIRLGPGHPVAREAASVARHLLAVTQSGGLTILRERQGDTHEFDSEAAIREHQDLQRAEERFVQAAVEAAHATLPASRDSSA